MIECRILATPLDATSLIAAASDPACGAVAVFIGTARESSSARPGDEVATLEYEAYVPMAEREMMAIAEEITAEHGVRNLLVHHRVGKLAIGEAAVAVVVASPHRAAAFDACRLMIEELKKRVPIWKKEVFDDGSEWVNARP
ncbi:MAG: molybdenum cofactor biosynthesis protein MoaE [Bacteroidota bacterium]